MHTKTKKIVITALFAALTCVATMIIHIPSPLHGYINLGDVIVLVAGFMLSPVCGFLAAGVGSALADFLSGYALYAPATFLIKGLMALVAFAVFRAISHRTGKLPARILGGILAEILMVLGYLVFESFLYGFLPSLANVPANAVQGAAGILLGVPLAGIFEKANIITD